MWKKIVLSYYYLGNLLVADNKHAQVVCSDVVEKGSMHVDSELAVLLAISFRSQIKFVIVMRHRCKRFSRERTCARGV